MRQRISDFKLAEFLIKQLLQHSSRQFVDMNVEFSQGDARSDTLYIDVSTNISQTIYKIVQSYIDYVTAEDGSVLFQDEVQKRDFMVATATFLRQFVYIDNVFDDAYDEGFNATRLYQNSFVWLIIKNIICPIYNRRCVNQQVIAGPSPYVDIARFCDKDAFDCENPKEPFIFLNTGVKNEAVRNVFLLLAAIDSLGLSSYEVIIDLFNSDLSDKLIGIIKLANNDIDTENFIMLLLGVLGRSADDFPGLAETKNASQPHNIKEAQSSSPAMWWYFGIIEKLLEPVRGSDWTVRKTLQPYAEAFWDKVEKFREKKLHKADGVPFNALLEMKWEDHKTDATQTLQSLLGSERIW